MMVPWMTSRSMPAAISDGVSDCAFCGLTRTAVVTPGLADARDRCAQQLGIQWRRMQLLQQPNGRRRFRLLLGGLDDLGDLLLDIGVPADQTLAVEHAEAAEAAQLDRRTPATPARRSDATTTGISNR